MSRRKRSDCDQLRQDAALLAMHVLSGASFGRLSGRSRGKFSRLFIYRFASLNEGLEAFGSSHYDQQHEEEQEVRPFLLCALKACTSLRDLETGQKIHSRACFSSIYVWTTLIDMYAKCGSLESSCAVFSRMPSHSIVSCNALLLGFVENREFELALQLFDGIQRELLNARTFVAAFMACAGIAAQEEGTRIYGNCVKTRILRKAMVIHLEAASRGYDASDVFVAASLVDLYAKCGSMVDARAVFEKLSLQHRDVVLWTALLQGYVDNGEFELAIELYEFMLFQRKTQQGCGPNARTFVAAITACAALAGREDGKEVDGRVVKVKCLEKGMAIHSQAAKSFCESDCYVATSVVDMYAKCRSLVDARRVFDRSSHHDVVLWTSLVLGYVENGENELSLEAFANMVQVCSPNSHSFVAAMTACANLAVKEDGEDVGTSLLKLRSLEKGMFLHSQAVKLGFDTDIYVGSALVDVYAKCGSLVNARTVFDRMPDHDVVTWTSLLMGYAENGESKLTLDLFTYMELKPSSQTYVAVVMACGSLVDLETGKQIHARICRSGLEDKCTVVNGLVDFYGKCGDMVSSQQVFDSTAFRTIVLWNTLITGYGHQGDVKKVSGLFQKMLEEGIQPDAITLLCVLTACSHAGMIARGRKYFDEMQSRYDILPGIRHYSCMVDMFCRAGRADEALAMVKLMPFNVDFVTYTTLLTACSLNI